MLHVRFNWDGLVLCVRFSHELNTSIVVLLYRVAEVAHIVI